MNGLMASIPPDMCWRRGTNAGTIPKCPTGYTKQGALCYKECKSGYKNVLGVCWKKCSSGYKDIGALCVKKRQPWRV